MEEPRSESNHGKAADGTPGKLAAGFALDLVFGFVLIAVSSITPNFGIAFLITMGLILALWAVVRMAHMRRVKRKESERLRRAP